MYYETVTNCLWLFIVQVHCPSQSLLVTVRESSQTTFHKVSNAVSTKTKKSTILLVETTILTLSLGIIDEYEYENEASPVGPLHRQIHLPISDY